MIKQPCKFYDGNTENRKRSRFLDNKRRKPKDIFCSKMNRLFGRGKPKEPPPNLTDAISNVSSSKSNSKCLPACLSILASMHVRSLLFLFGNLIFSRLTVEESL